MSFDEPRPAHTPEKLTSLINAATLKGSAALKFGNRPYFPEVVAEHGGMFVRIKAGSADYRVGRVVNVSTTGIYTLKNKQYDVRITVDTFSANVPLKLDCLSSSPATQEEIDVYIKSLGCKSADERLAKEAHVADECPKLREEWKKNMVNRVINTVDAKAVMASNTKLEGSMANPVYRMASMSTMLRTQAIQQASQEASGLVGENSGMLSPQRSHSQLETQTTQIAFGDSFAGNNSFASPMSRQPTTPGGEFGSSQMLLSPGGLGNVSQMTQNAVSDLLAQNASFSSYIASPDRVQEGLRLRSLTDRNKHKNEIRTLQAANNFTKYAKTGKLEESGLLWEVEDDKRKELCEQYDLAKEGNDPAEQQGEAKAAETVKLNAQEEQLERCVSAHREHSMDIGADISDDIFDVARKSQRDSASFGLGGISGSADDLMNVSSGDLAGLAGGDSPMQSPRGSMGGFASPLNARSASFKFLLPTAARPVSMRKRGRDDAL